MKRGGTWCILMAAVLWISTGAAAALAAPGNLQWTTTVGIVSEDAVMLQATVERIGGVDGAITVDYATFDIEAIAGSDYEAAVGTLAWNDGEGGARAIELALVDDPVSELQERFGVMLSNPTGGALIEGGTQFLVLVDDDDGPPPGGRLQWTSAVVAGDEGEGVLVFTLERVEASAGPISIDYASGDIEAFVGEDYTAVSGTLHWADGETEAQTIEVPILDDSEVELQERFTVELSSVVGDAQVLGSQQAVGYIDDNDGTPSGGRLQWSATVMTGDEGVGSLAFSVERIEASSGSVSIDYATVDIEALAGSDYTGVSGTLSWDDGETDTQTITVPIIDDAAVEMQERFALQLSNPVGDVQILGSTQAIGYIDDDDTPDIGLLRFEHAAQDVLEDAGSIQLTVQRVGGSAGEIGVGYASADVGAVAGNDYTAVSGTLTWLDGDASPRFIVVPLLDDSSQEPNESFHVTLGTPTGGAGLDSPGLTSVTILDDGDLPPSTGTLAFDPHIYPVTEEDGVVQLIVTRSGGDAGEVTVDYASVAMSAEPGSDFVATSGTLTWPAGDDDPRFISVDLLDDAAAESGETFRVELSAPGGDAVLGAQSTGFVQIADDDEEVVPDAFFRDGFE